MAIRQITVSGSMFVVDHETFGSNEKKTVPILGDAVVNTDGVGSELIQMAVGVGGEVRVELELSVSADSSQIAHVNGVARLFEGDDEGTQDLEDTETIIKQILPGQNRNFEIHLVNAGFGGGDKADIKLNITNAKSDIILTGGGFGNALPKQEGWRWCHRCQGMWFGSGDSAGRCPTGGGHSLNGSGNYSLVHGVAYPGGQQLWRWCHKCMGLWFSGGAFGDFGLCPVGGGHSSDGSGNYVLTDHASSQAQGAWRWCHACTGMWFSGNGTGGRCPRTGGEHSLDGSGDYQIIVS